MQAYLWLNKEHGNINEKNETKVLVIQTENDHNSCKIKMNILNKSKHYVLLCACPRSYAKITTGCSPTFVTLRENREARLNAVM